MKVHSVCPLCRSEKIQKQPLSAQPHLHKCAKCKHCFDERMPEDQNLAEHYAQYGRDDYRSPITVNRYSELLDSFERITGKGSILDIGSGIGFFLEVAKEKGWKVYGTEFTGDAVEIGRQKGIEMFEGGLEEIDFGDLQFDVITSFEVIEHLKQPKDHLIKIRSLLKEGGLFFATTPNYNSLNRLLLGSKWNVISYPEHLQYFSNASLDFVLRSSGLAPIYNRSTGISPGRLINSLKNKGMDFSSDNTTDEKLRASLEYSPILNPLKSLVNFFLSFLGIGESLKVLAEKK